LGINFFSLIQLTAKGYDKVPFFLLLFVGLLLSYVGFRIFLKSLEYLDYIAGQRELMQKKLHEITEIGLKSRKLSEDQIETIFISGIFSLCFILNFLGFIWLIYK